MAMTFVLYPALFGIVGLNFNPMYNFNKYFRAGVSVDAQYDESANIKDYRVEESSSSDVKFHRPPFHKQFAVGLSVRGGAGYAYFFYQCRYRTESDMQW